MCNLQKKKKRSCKTFWETLCTVTFIGLLLEGSTFFQLGRFFFHAIAEHVTVLNFFLMHMTPVCKSTGHAYSWCKLWTQWLLRLKPGDLWWQFHSHCCITIITVAMIIHYLGRGGETSDDPVTWFRWCCCHCECPRNAPVCRNAHWRCDFHVELPSRCSWTRQIWFLHLHAFKTQSKTQATGLQGHCTNRNASPLMHKQVCLSPYEQTGVPFLSCTNRHASPLMHKQAHLSPYA